MRLASPTQLLFSAVAWEAAMQLARKLPAEERMPFIKKNMTDRYGILLPYPIQREEWHQHGEVGRRADPTQLLFAAVVWAAMEEYHRTGESLDYAGCDGGYVTYSIHASAWGDPTGGMYKLGMFADPDSWYAEHGWIEE